MVTMVTVGLLLVGGCAPANQEGAAWRDAAQAIFPPTTTAATSRPNPSASPLSTAPGAARTTQSTPSSTIASSVAAPEPEAALPAPAVTAPAVPDGLRPARIALPSIGVDAAVVDLGITDGSIEVPTDWAKAGWLSTGPAPGQQGPAVIAGHVDSTSGPAVFFELRTLKPGDPVIVTRRDGSTVTFAVDGLERFSKASFPTREVYGPVPGPALRLLTCGGHYDKSAGGYQDNVVVFAS